MSRKGPRPFCQAEASWRQISIELRTPVLGRPEPKATPTSYEKLAKKAMEEITITEEVSRITIVSGKWKFKS